MEKKGADFIEEKPLFSIDTKPTIPSFPDVEKEKINIKYPLIPPYAYAHIFWDSQNKELVYFIEEPALNQEQQRILGILEDGIKELINISFIAVKSNETIIKYLEKNLRVLLNELRIEISRDSYLKIMYYIYRNFVGFNEIEPLLNDYFIEDIECNGLNSPIYIVHRKYRNLRTNIVFTNLENLTSFVEKLAQKCGQYISYANPLLDGALPDGSRANATFTEDISSKGPTFTIRKFTKRPWTPTKLIQMGTASPQIFAYLWLLIEYEMNIMVIGGTGSGKTTFLNALTFFIPPQARIVSIEDTKELNIEHENWLPSIARAGVGLTNLVGQKYGEVSLFALLKESFRQNPDYVIIGEVRGEEAYVLFQGMASIKGEEEILIIKDSKPCRIKIKDLAEVKNCYAITYDLINNNQVKILPITAVVRHPERNLLYKVTTKMGREITLTPDHSLFKFSDGLINSKMEDLSIGDSILIPGKIPSGYNDLDYINLLDLLPNIRVYAPKIIKEAVSKIGYYNASDYCGVKSISDYYANFKRSKPSSLKAKSFIELMKKASIEYNLDDLKVKFYRQSEPFNPNFKLTSEFLRLLGYYISEGSLGINRSDRMAFYNKNEKIIEDMKHCIFSITGKNPSKRIITRGFGTCTELSFNSKVIYEFLKLYCGFKDNKKIPDFIFGISKEKIGQFLSALYDGDGSFNNAYFGYYTISKKLADDITKLLLTFGIVARINKRNRLGRNTTDYEILFYSAISKNEFLKYVNPLKWSKKIFEGKGKEKNRIGDLYIDEIKSIEMINLDKKEFVYDISVFGSRNFVGGFGGILLHNSGHPSMGTMHANSVDTLIRRLETPPINLSASLVETLDVACVITQTKIKGAEVRRVREIAEIVNVQESSRGANINIPFYWDPSRDVYLFKSESHVFNKIMMRHGLSRDDLIKEFNLRTQLLINMYKKSIFDFREVKEVINEYYKDPKSVLKKFEVLK